MVKFIKLVLFVLVPCISLANHKILIFAPTDKIDGPYSTESLAMDHLKSLLESQLITNSSLQPYVDGDLLRLETNNEFKAHFSLLIEDANTNDTHEITIMFLAHGKLDYDGSLKLWGGPNNNQLLEFSKFLSDINQVLVSADVQPLKVNILVHACYSGACVIDYKKHKISKQNKHDIEILGLGAKDRVSVIEDFSALINDANSIDLFFKNLNYLEFLREETQIRRWFYYLSLTPYPNLFQNEFNDEDIIFTKLLSSSNDSSDYEQEFNKLSIEEKVLYASALTSIKRGNLKLSIILENIKQDNQLHNLSLDSLVAQYPSASLNIKLIYYLIQNDILELVNLLDEILASPEKLHKLNTKYFRDLTFSLTKKYLLDISENTILENIDSIFILNAINILAPVSSNTITYLVPKANIQLFNNTSNFVINKVSESKKVKDYYYRVLALSFKQSRTYEESARSLRRDYNLDLIEASERQFDLELEYLNFEESSLYLIPKRIHSILGFIASLENEKYIQWVEDKIHILSSNKNFVSKFEIMYNKYSTTILEKPYSILQLIIDRMAFKFQIISESSYTNKLLKNSTYSFVLRAEHPILHKYYTFKNSMSLITSTSCSQIIAPDY